MSETWVCELCGTENTDTLNFECKLCGNKDVELYKEVIKELKKLTKEKMQGTNKNWKEKLALFARDHPQWDLILPESISRDLREKISAKILNANKKRRLTFKDIGSLPRNHKQILQNKQQLERYLRNMATVGNHAGINPLNISTGNLHISETAKTNNEIWREGMLRKQRIKKKRKPNNAELIAKKLWPKLKANDGVSGGKRRSTKGTKKHRRRRPKKGTKKHRRRRSKKGTKKHRRYKHKKTNRKRKKYKGGERFSLWDCPEKYRKAMNALNKCSKERNEKSSELYNAKWVISILNNEINDLKYKLKPEKELKRIEQEKLLDKQNELNPNETYVG